MSKIIEGLKYSETHEWVKVEGEIAVIGVTDFAQKEMGEITYVDCPDVDDEVEKVPMFEIPKKCTAPAYASTWTLSGVSNPLPLWQPLGVFHSIKISCRYFGLHLKDQS